MADARCVLAAAVSISRALALFKSEGRAAAVCWRRCTQRQVHGLILYAATAMVVQRDGEPAWADIDQIEDGGAAYRRQVDRALLQGSTLRFTP